MYLDFSIRWEAILQYDALTTEPFQSQQTRLLNAICDFGHKTDLLHVTIIHSSLDFKFCIHSLTLHILF